MRVNAQNHAKENAIADAKKKIHAPHRHLLALRKNVRKKNATKNAARRIAAADAKINVAKTNAAKKNAARKSVARRSAAINANAVQDAADLMAVIHLAHSHAIPLCGTREG